ncbi:MAG TPA: DUF2779 domain-containing protein [Verrucomicrobiota bacterium]|jgi:hypothetical protein|nr:MAG: hypothetical protein BWX84_01270 [Verrucomicrobia bacterium ADurb.Bin118]HPY31138.1 DUF2779 domain-containing protein [Verrucomicrobiota bacterium]HQB17543.1 DUF2779 domain-containing protein [Verrucomicrobiota bacterium]
MTVTHPPSLSKSTFLMGRQCSKLLWFRYNARDQIPAPDEAQQAVFDQGHEVGNLAKQLFPGGIEIDAAPGDFDGAIRRTTEALLPRRPLYEATFAHGGGYVRADILVPVAGGAWDLVEVKSTTRLQEEVHLPDIAFQAFALTGAGIPLRKCFLAHINGEFVRRGPIDPRKFFTLEDVTQPVSIWSRDIEDQIDAMQRVIGARSHPDIPIGPHCGNPYPCPLHDHCWSFLPEASVFTLYRGGAKGFTLLKQGIQKLADIPAAVSLTNTQAIQRAALLAGQPHIDRPALAAFLGQLEYPVSFLDFETIGPAIPLFDDASPYQPIPFQFSLHIRRRAAAPLEHRSFLAEGTADPRPEFMRQLKAALPATGSVVAYNAGFETGRLRECCELLPAFKPWLRQVTPRIVDLLLPFRGFRYYHPAQNGSNSMKAVLPALTGQGYEGLAIQEGGMASREFLRVTHGQVTAAERRRVRRDLEEYCGLDTLGMVQIVDQLKRLTA